jgi:hypothetical protein
MKHPYFVEHTYSIKALWDIYVRRFGDLNPYLLLFGESFGIILSAKPFSIIYRNSTPKSPKVYLTNYFIPRETSGANLNYLWMQFANTPRLSCWVRFKHMVCITTTIFMVQVQHDHNNQGCDSSIWFV